MLFYILLAVIVVTVLSITIYYWVDSGDFVDCIAFFFVVGFIGTIIFASLGGVVFGTIATDNSTIVTTSRTDTPLTALNTGSEVSGRFFLGSGRIDSDSVFSYIYETPEGGYRLDSVYVDQATVYADEETNPYMTTITWERKPDTFWAPFTLYGVSDTYEFHIPQGSILVDYTVTP